ncbi:MAG TPA: response regulator transcription factor [Flavisolibacter sp.]|nr:response regulator transcription factor [Flavisolibacter sp.]
MNTEIVRIGLVDDHSVLRESLSLFLSQQLHFLVTLQARDGLELQEKLQACSFPDVLLLDVRMKGMGGLETMMWLSREHPEQKVIIYTGCETDLTRELFYSLGARAVVSKWCSEKELEKALRRVHEEGYYYNDLASRRLLTRMHAEAAKRSRITKPLLSEKEMKFLQLAGTDLTYEQIADRLKLKTGCINKMRYELFQKLSCQNRAVLAMMAERNGLNEWETFTQISR